jgi:flavin-dependent dehydrogenase
MYDVAIVGGGPAGSTLGCLLKRYNPSLEVLILEREVFPRDHVGESQLPAISHLLHEMGCWEKVESANFPVKIGATYRWGKTPELWDFDFMPQKFIKNEPRPAKFEGQRVQLAFQVDRAIYDQILLDHAEELGCVVRQGTRVLKCTSADDSVTALSLEGGEEITARWYIDASGHSGILRRNLGVGVTSPTSLQNIAVWDYWQNAKWAEEIGIDGTRVQVMSLGYGWIWFIPLGPTRTSVGLVMPKQTFKESGKEVSALYLEAIQADERIRGLMEGAVRENKLETTKDWSFISDRHSGPNWILVGESSGFADPILAAGMTIAQVSAQEAAYTILTADLGEDKEWLLACYEDRQTHRLNNHIRFADYWYTANAQFTELQDFTAELAKDSGLSLSPDKAWAWLAQGGFIIDDFGATLGGIHLSLVGDLSNHMGNIPAASPLNTKNVFIKSTEGAIRKDYPSYLRGKVMRVPTLERKGKIWPLSRYYQLWYRLLDQTKTADGALTLIAENVLSRIPRERWDNELFQIGSAIEALIADGWVKATYDSRKPLANLMNYTPTIHWHEDTKPVEAELLV